MNPCTTIDCRGQRCPEPILATAKAAHGLRVAGGGLLEITADDDAFPLDIRSWCRRAGAELVELSASVAGEHRARVMIGTVSAVVVRSSAGGGTAPGGHGPAPARPVETLDLRGQSCPGPILGLARHVRALEAGTVLEVVADDPAFKLDLEAWCRSSGASIVAMSPEGSALRARLRVGGGKGSVPEKRPPAIPPVGRYPTLVSEIVTLRQSPRPEARPTGREHLFADAHESGVQLVPRSTAPIVPVSGVGAIHRPMAAAHTSREVAVATTEDQCTLLVLHSDREALLAALLVAVGAASQGMRVMMFFTFWGLNLLRGDEPNPHMPAERVSWVQRMFKWMMPRGPRRQKLGKLDMGGLGRTMLGSIMKRYQLMDIPELMAAAEEQGVRLVACTMSMQVMGITKRDLAARDNLEYGGVAAFVEASSRSKMSLAF